MSKLFAIIRKIFVKPLPSSNLTVRFMFPLLAGFISILGAAVISSLDSSYIRLEPSQTLVMKGEIFMIDIYASAHVPVNAIDVAITFSPEMVEIESIDTGRSVLTIWTQEPVVENNTIKFGGGTFRRGFVGEHLVATIKAKAKYNGRTEFSITDAKLLAGDGQGTTVKITEKESNTKTSFYIYDQNEDPEKISATLDIKLNPDIDGDGKVTLKDVSVFMTAWHSKKSTFDFNEDGRMNFIDFSIILAKTILY
jgi:hypothetical protein